MYIMITSYCGMTCNHCIFACGTKAIRPKHMSREVFEACLEYSDSGVVAIGGGEPTDHPTFWEFFGLAVGSSEAVWMATNGKNTNTVLGLAGLAGDGSKFDIALSRDQWHDPIDQKVVRKFEEYGLEIRTVTKIVNSGTAREHGISTVSACGCADIHVKPNGDIHPCACDDAPKLANVMEDSTEYLDAIKQGIYELGQICHRTWDTDDLRTLKFTYGIDVPDNDYYTPSEIEEEEDEY